MRCLQVLFAVESLVKIVALGFTVKKRNPGSAGRLSRHDGRPLRGAG